MPTYEYSAISNIQDGPESEFEKVKREVLAKVDPVSHHCMVERYGKLEVVRFSTFSKTTETNEIFVVYHQISEFSVVPSESCWPSEVYRMNDQNFQWPEDQLSRVGYYSSTVKLVE